MKEYRSYLDHLHALLTQVVDGRHSVSENKGIEAALNGEPSEKLRELVPLERLRASGAYFTNTDLRETTLQSFLETIDGNSVILDPACGAGDLLLGCVERIPRGNTVSETIHTWGRQVVGWDLHSEFVLATKVRLFLAALSQGLENEGYEAPEIETAFPKIVQQNGLASPKAIQSATHIVLNPPFTHMRATENCDWGSGMVNSAAIFLETCIKNARKGTRIAAILPDVLRSGSNYERWRAMIEEHTHEERIQLYGSFDHNVDVDVFVAEFLVGNVHDSGGACRWHRREAPTMDTVGDRFDIRVGPVVDYRHARTGPTYPFIKSRDLPAWKELETFRESRQFEGTVFSGPFVVVRRTSRVRDKHRAVGTIVSFSGSVAVENHLLVLLPKDGSVKTCRALLDVLCKPETSEWLNERIRCRHLTISSLAGIPWWSSDSNEQI